MSYSLLKQATQSSSLYWFNPSYAEQNGGSSASYIEYTTGIQNAPKYHWAFDGADIPHTAHIKGIMLYSDLYEGTPGCARDNFRWSLSWDAGSHWTSEAILVNQINGSEHTFYAGSPTELWGHTWTPDEINADSFRIRTTLYSASTCIGDGPWTFYDDWSRVVVYYVEIPPLNSAVWSNPSQDSFFSLFLFIISFFAIVYLFQRRKSKK